MIFKQKISANERRVACLIAYYTLTISYTPHVWVTFFTRLFRINTPTKKLLKYELHPHLGSCWHQVINLDTLKTLSPKESDLIQKIYYQAQKQQEQGAKIPTAT